MQNIRHVETSVIRNSDMAISMDKRVVGYIRTHPKCQTQAIQRTLAINKHEINQILYALEAKKIIQRTSSNPALWSLYQKRLSSPLRDSESGIGDLRASLSNSAESQTSIDYLQPISLLNYIAAKFSLTFTFEEQQVDDSDWEVKTSLRDPVNAARKIEETGAISRYLDTARYSACIKILRTISKSPELPFSDIALKFMESVPGESPILPISNENVSPPPSPKNNSPQLFQTGSSPISHFDPLSLETQYSTPPTLFYQSRRILYIKEQYDGEESAFLEFKGSRGPEYEYPAFRYAFNQMVWDYIAAFINLHANGTIMTPNPKIIFGVSDRGEIQGIKTLIPRGASKEEIIRQKRDEFSRKIVDLANAFVQPKEITSHVMVHLEEVFMPHNERNNDFFYFIVEVIVAIPNFPTICSVRDIFYYHQPNAGSISKMTLHQLHSRFTSPGFRFVS